MTSNIQAIVSGEEEKFEVHFVPYPFKRMSFEDAAKHTANLIDYRYPELCVGVSGGADSEFVVRLFHRLHIRFIPVIIHYDGNEEDLQSAYDLCQELKIDYQIIKVNEEDIIRYYLKHIYGELHNDGLNHTFQMMITDYAKEWGKVAVLGETHVFDPNPNRSIVRAFKFIPELHYRDVVPFYYYTLELAFAEMCEIREGETSEQFKSRVRGTRLRHKCYPKYSFGTMNKYLNVEKILNPTTLLYDMGTPNDFIKHMENYIK